MREEKFFPITINSNLCIRCQKCTYSCPQKAIFFMNSMRYVNFDKCGGCLKCVDVCEHGAIEVISIEKGQLNGFFIDKEKCNLCKICLKNEFCFQNLFRLQRDKNGEEKINFQKKEFTECYKCLICLKNCPNKAIYPEIY